MAQRNRKTFAETNTTARDGAWRPSTRALTAKAQRNRWLAILATAAAIPPLLLISPHRRGPFLAVIGQPTRALRLYERIMSQNPTDGSVLQRAWALASAHGIEAALDSNFEQYLRAKPTDATIAQIAAGYFWKKGMRERAVELYVRCIAVGAALPQEAYDRLRGFYGTGVPSNALRTLKQGLRGAASPPDLSF